MTNQSLTNVSERPKPPMTTLIDQLSERAQQFKAALPAHITPEKFQRVVVTAVAQDPDLLEADRRTFLNSCMRCAQDGLLPDKREAALVIFKTNKKVNGQWVTTKAVQYMPMIAGLRKKILQSGEVISFDTQVVYFREYQEGSFIYEAGTNSMLRHKPMLNLTSEDVTDENIIAAYSVAMMKDGTHSYEVMRRFEIDKVRETSQTGATKNKKGEPREPSGPWVDWFSEQCRKTVARRHSKRLPMSGDILDLVERGDEVQQLNSVDQVLLSADPTPPSRTAHDSDGVVQQVNQDEGIPAHMRDDLDENPTDDDVSEEAELSTPVKATSLEYLIGKINSCETRADMDAMWKTNENFIAALTSTERSLLDVAFDMNKESLLQ